MNTSLRNSKPFLRSSRFWIRRLSFLFHLVSASNEHSYVVRFAAKDPQRTLSAPELGTLVNPVELLYFSTWITEIGLG